VFCLTPALCSFTIPCAEMDAWEVLACCVSCVQPIGTHIFVDADASATNRL
jgi:hypothetical protein